MTFSQQIAELIRQTAHDILVPAGPRIADLKIEEKGPNDFVTEIDKAMEAALSEQLTALLPGSVVLGEEAASLEPGLIDSMMKTDKPLWIIDPLDGTNAFINQSGGYGPMVSLMENGIITGAWIYDVKNPPLVNLDTVQDIYKAPPVREKIRGTVGAKTKKFLLDRGADYAAFDVTEASPPSCVSYTRMLTGEIDFIVYQITQPWDHLVGMALIEKTGMCALQWNGQPASYTNRNNGLVIARTAEIAEEVLAKIVRPATNKAGFPYDDHGQFRYAKAA